MWLCGGGGGDDGHGGGSRSLVIALGVEANEDANSATEIMYVRT